MLTQNETDVQKETETYRKKIQRLLIVKTEFDKILKR